MKKKVAIVGTVGIPAKYGGFETLAEQLVKNLHTYFSFTTYCSSVFYKKKQKHPHSKLVYIPLNANGKWSVLYDAISIIHAVFYADVILVLGVSAGFMIPLVRFFTSKKVITNIDGLEWKRQKWSSFAKNYLKGQEKIAVKYSHKIIADSKAIQEYVLQEYNTKSNYIAYGGNHVNTILQKETTKKYAFSVCRIEPENNIHIILNAFSKTNYNLVFVGNWNVSNYGKDLKNKYKDYKNIEVLDPIYNQQELDKIRANATIYIHGHSAGGTNPSLVEAMWLGLPIFSWNVVYNRLTTQENALFFNSENQLKNLLKTSSKELKEIGKNLKEIAVNNYHWKKIANQYKDLFNFGLDLITPINKVTISASIVIYKTDVTMLKKAVNSFINTPIDKKLFLIDNSPTDVLRGEFNHPEIEYLYLGKNVGYGTANNTIIDKIKDQSEYHLILNPDIYFDGNVIPALISEHKKDDNLALIAPKTLYPNGEFQYSCRRYPSFFELLYRRLNVFKSKIHKGEYRDLDLTKPFNPDFIQGAFMLFKTVDFMSLKGFDERFFMYLEDVDLCRRVDTIQKKKLYYPKVKVYHKYTQGSAKNLTLFLFHLYSAIQYFCKWIFIPKNDISSR